MKSVTVVGNPVHGGELGRRGDVVEYSLPGYVATTDDQFFEIVARWQATPRAQYLRHRLAIGAVEDTARGLDALWRHYSNIACVSRQP